MERKINLILLCCFLLVGCGKVHAQEQKPAPGETWPDDGSKLQFNAQEDANGATENLGVQRIEKAKVFSDCKLVNQDGNMDGYQTAGEYYQCAEGIIKLKGKWTLFYEDGYIYRQQLGRLDGEPYRATELDHKMYRWCPVPHSKELEMCGPSNEPLPKWETR